MGTKMGPSYANLFVGYMYIEHQFFSQDNGPKPELYRHYIEEVLCQHHFFYQRETQSVYNCS